MRLWTLFLTGWMTAAAFGADAEHGGSDESVFAGTLAQSVAAIIVFLILFAVLSKFAWGPILKGLQDREGKIRGDLAQAQAAADEAKTTLEQYQDQLAAAADEAGKIIEQGKADAQKIATGLKEQAQADINQIRQRAELDIRGAKEQAINEIYAQGADLATTLAGRILQREIRGEDHQKLIQESLATMSEQGG